MTETFRYERKLYFPDSYPEELIGLIKTNQYGFSERYKERRVNSIYYETASMDSYFDNENGHGNRVKFRTRWYGDNPTPNKDSVHELKFKNGFTGYKIRESVKKESLYLSHIMKITKPILKVSYLRRYFESFDGKIRMTIDRDIIYEGLQNDASRKIPVVEKGCVVEIKYNPDYDATVSKILSGFGHRIDKFSKYSRGVKYCYR